MNNAIIKVLERKDDIMSKTMEYEKKSHDCTKDEITSGGIIVDDDKSYSKLFDFFDKNFSDDEIMVIQSIMYFGRECFCHNNYNCGNSIEEIILHWMKGLHFSFGRQIQKDIEIHQMIEKGLKIGTYFKCGFENLK